MITKFFKTIFVLLFCFLTSFAQSKRATDSLSEEFLSKKRDLLSIDIKNCLILEYIDNNPDTSLSLVKENLIQINKLNYLRGKAVSLYLLTFIYKNKGEYQKALMYAKEGLILSKQTKYEQNIANIYGIMAKIYLVKGEYSESLTYLFNALKIKENSKDKQGITTLLTDIGNVYSAEKKYKEAITYYKDALQISENIKDSIKIVICMNNIGDIYEQLGQNNRALSYYERALKLKKSITNNNRILPTLLSNIGGIYAKQAKYYTALPYLYQSFNAFQKMNYVLGITQVSIKIAELYTKINQLDSAKKYAFISLDKSLILQAKPNIQESYLALYIIEKQQKNFEKAIIFYEKSVKINDSIYSEDKEKIFDELQTKYKTKQQEQQIKLLEIEHEKETFQRYLLIAMIAFLIIFVLVLSFFTLRINKDNKLLSSKNIEINQKKEEVKQLNEHLEELVETRTKELKHSIDGLIKQNQDLEQFSYIISHNIRSPIARILGLINVFNVENMNDSFNLEILGHLEQAGENLDMVIKDLNKVVTIRSNLDTTKEEVILNNELTITLEHLTTQISNSNTKISYLFEVESISFIKSYIQSILYNLLSNAIKYKDKNREPIIHIKTELQSNFVCLSVQDNGLGIDLEKTDIYKIFGLYQRMHDHVQGKGLGLFLVKTQIESLGGRVELESSLGVGSTFKVYFPI